MFQLLNKKSTDENQLISIEHLWPKLRSKQYYNTLCDLRQELNILQSIPGIEPEIRTKAIRSLEKINILIMKMDTRLN
jgi:hypothetical protein